MSSTKAELEAELAMLDSKREALKERERWLTAEYGEQAVPSRFGALSGGMDEQEEPKPERRRPGPKVSAIKSAVMTSATAAEAGRSERVVAAIALVERNIEGGIRQDGPPLGVRFDPIPKDPWVGESCGKPRALGASMQTSRLPFAVTFVTSVTRGGLKFCTLTESCCC